MSVSIHSETSKDEIDTEDTELEDLVWNLMSRTGLLPQLRGQIAKFIEDNGKAENIQIYPERADTKLLGLIFEYLQWIGMKQTNSVLLSEAPVDVDLSFIKSGSGDADYRPELFRIFEEHFAEDRGTPTRSHNYSKDEFEDSRLTSASVPHSIRSNEEIENEANSNDRNSESPRLKNSPSEASDTSYKAEAEDKQESVKDEMPEIENQVKPGPEGFGKGDGSADLLISFDSPVATAPKSFDLHRPHVTVRQRFDEDDPFNSPVGKFDQHIKASRSSTTPNTASDNNQERQKFLSATSLFRKENEGNLEVGNAKGDGTEETFKPSEDAKDKDNSKNLEEVKQPKPIDEPDQQQQKDVKVSPDDDESTSDFMETLTIEEDTQDVSIPSNEKGMSSCEHVVSLK